MSFIRSFTINTTKQHPFPFNIPAVKFARDIHLDEKVTIFVGDNGSGKSTLLETIASYIDVPLIGGHIGSHAGFEAANSLELQTPLAIIRSKLDLLIQQENFTPEQINSLSDTYGSISRLSKLNKSLLLLTKIGNNQFVDETGINIKEKLEYKISQFQEIWDDGRLACESRLEEAYITANADLIDIFLNNVLSNATRHNYPGGHISIELHHKQLRVTNSGKRQALENEKLFKRFYKVANNDDGNGLGLPIVKQICERAGMNPTYQYHSGDHEFIFSW